MKIIVLLENNKCSKDLISKHGLSIYIEHSGVNIIFDVGPDDSYLKNAKKLGVDIKNVDYLLISHGHSDHGGGIEAFLKENDKGKVILSKNAFDKHYTSFLKYIKIYIGLDPKVINDRFIFVEEEYDIEEVGKVFSNVQGNVMPPSMNNSLLKKTDKGYVTDKFDHEMSLIIKDDNRGVLISGCSHKGIINIIEKFASIENTTPNIVLAGMHLYNPVTKKRESDQFIVELSKKLSCYNIEQFYTYHCTGNYAYEKMKEYMGTNIQALSTGDILNI